MENQNEREIDLIDLIFHLLYRWRSLIITALICFVAFGCYKYISSEKLNEENNTLIAEGKLDEVKYPDAYQSAMDALQTKNADIRKAQVKITDLQNNIRKTQDTISAAKTQINSNKKMAEVLNLQIAQNQARIDKEELYLKDSIVMGFDFSAVPTSTKVYQVVLSVNSSSLANDPADEIISAYINKINKATINGMIKAGLQTNSSYVTELYSISSDISGNTVTVTAMGSSEAKSKAILDIVCKELEKDKDTIADDYSKHSLDVLSENFEEVLNNNIFKKKQESEDKILSYQNSNAEFLDKASRIEKEIEALETSIVIYEVQIKNYTDSIAEEQYNLDKLLKDLPELEEKYQAKIPSQARSIKDGIKFGIIGFFVGAVVLALFYCVGYIFNGKVHTADELHTTFNLSVLAVMNRPKRKRICFIDKWFMSWRGELKETVSDQEKLKTLAVSLNAIIEKDSKVALLSSVKSDKARFFEETLNKSTKDVKFITVEQSIESEASAKKLLDCDSVLILEHRELSKTKNISEELKQVKLLSKKVLGIIVG